MKTITQREARRLRKRVTELEALENDRRNAWVKQFPNGIHIRTLDVAAESWHVVNTARKLGHAVVATCNNNLELELFALPLGGSTIDKS